MEYITEYEVIGNRVCGIIKDPNTNAPIYHTELCNSQQEASVLVHNFIATKTEPQGSVPLIQRKTCCGR